MNGSSPNYIYLLAVNWRKLAAGALIAAAAGVLYSLGSSRVYESSATVLVYPPVFKQMEQLPAAQSDAQPILSVAEMMPKTLAVEIYESIAQSDELYHGVIESLGIEDMYAEDLRDALRVETARPPGSAAREQRSDAYILRLFARAGEPEMAAQIVQKWAELFKERADELAFGGLTQAYADLEAMWDSTLDELVAAEEAVERFQGQWSLDAMAKQLSAKESLRNEYEIELLKTEVDIAIATAKLDGVRAEIALEDKVETLFKAPPDEAYWQARLQQQAGPADTSILGPEDGLKNETYNPTYTVLKQQAVSLQTELEGAEARRFMLESQIGQLEEEINALREEVAALNTEEVRLARTKKLYENTFGLVSTKLEKGRIAQVSTTSDIIIAANAVPPQRPAGPRRAISVAAAALVGLLLSGAFVVVEHLIRQAPESQPAA
jgi:uncharacterized protein involved in exopolysaccharide biosynthesis